jgi:anti-sigma B factor antagonist
VAEELTSRTTRTDDAVVVTLAGELEMSATFWLEPELERLTEGDDVAALLLDMAGVHFMDSAALGLLLATQARLQSAGIRFAVVDPSPAVRRILRATGTAGVLGVDSPPP